MKLLLLLAILLSVGCTPTRPDGTPYACALEQMGGTCAGSTAEGMAAYNRARVGQIITGLEVGAY